MALEQTLVLIKPDGLVKSLTGNVITQLSKAKLILVGSKVVRVNKELAEKHYEELKEKSFFPELIQYIMGEIHNTPRVLALVYQGDDAIKKIRDIVGATSPEEADPVSIRGAYGRITTSGIIENVVHASSSVGDAEKEIKLWFKPIEIVERIYSTKSVMLNGIEDEVWT
ncbi:MAG: nucleoside-diphosphate kinase [Spirochaetota bacterium]|nr:nucleoside-diphosphate kinase [Spirochaetota bacterium]